MSTTPVKTWRETLAAVLEWSPVDKGQIMMLMLVPVLVQYQLWAWAVLQRPDREELVNVAALTRLMWSEALLAVGAVLLIGLGRWLRRHWPDTLWFQHVSAQYYTLTLCYLGYQVGMNAISTGIVLLGAPVFGFIVMNRRVIWPATTTALVGTLGLSYCSALGYLPYAPVMVQPTTPASELFHLNSMLGFAAPHFIIILLLADQTLSWWRQREDTIRELSRTDALTGLNNRRAIMEMLDKEVARTRRHGPPLAVVILDLDHFKKINDSWGHPTGDRVLQQAAQVLRQCIRQTDVVGRYGGEEFMIVLPDTTLEGAAVLIERCRAQLAAAIITADSGETFTISASFGLVGNEQNMVLASEALIKLADDALYRAKAGGRNRVEIAAAA
ncbi:MAG: hypothetical protein K0Q68_525 [Moraxellaceae bacterium]|jgi:diguanylate cyclase (GGDEF)-like protein|nr:hypothetical protein [Moraxellaceae bacterium]